MVSCDARSSQVRYSNVSKLAQAKNDKLFGLCSQDPGYSGVMRGSAAEHIPDADLWDHIGQMQ